MTPEQISLTVVLISTLIYWAKTVFIEDRGNDHLFSSAMIIAGAATFGGFLFEIFTFKFIGEILGGFFGIWFSEKHYREVEIREEE